MAADDGSGGKPEIVIIRRRATDDGAAVKGGAWKIAYADFVTAMMAFFLVMWLINASNEATRSQVASYFNPIKLTDSSTGSRGLTDPKSALKKKSASSPPDKASGEEAQGGVSEESLLTDPKATLDRVMGLPAIRVGTSGSEGSGVASQGMGERADPIPVDPFDPRSWESVGIKSGEEADVPANDRPVDVHLRAAEKASPPMREREERHLPAEISPAKAQPTPSIGTSDAPAAVQDPIISEELEAAEIEAIESQILERLGKTRRELEGGLDVKRVPDGVLISLTDKHLLGMFRSGSAEPEPKLVELMGAIAGVLQAHKGHIVIRGHTDSSPYRGRKYDNWQLSTARAHMAQYMLVRGGLDEQRIRRVEGLADREPRVPGNPGAAENRRIDILLGGTP